MLAARLERVQTFFRPVHNLDNFRNGRSVFFSQLLVHRQPLVQPIETHRVTLHPAGEAVNRRAQFLDSRGRFASVLPPGLCFGRQPHQLLQIFLGACQRVKCRALAFGQSAQHATAQIENSLGVANHQVLLPDLLLLALDRRGLLNFLNAVSQQVHLLFDAFAHPFQRRALFFKALNLAEHVLVGRAFVP